MIISRRKLTGALAAVGGLALSLAAAPGARAQTYEGLPNTFISPHGQPFRAEPDAPYAVADWFKQADKNADGKIDHKEFIDDAAFFFNVLDLNHDGVLSPFDISMYEHRVAPEILGAEMHLGALGGRPLPGHAGATLWLAQVLPDGTQPGGGQAHGPAGGIDPSGEGTHVPDQHTVLDETGQGASPYSLLPIPEPVTAGDTSFRGIVRKADFMSQADRNFTALDEAEDGFLTLAKLPKTPIQRILERQHKRRK